jgi:hypothetical protein
MKHILLFESFLKRDDLGSRSRFIGNLVFDFFDSKGQLLMKTETKSNTLVLKTDTFFNGLVLFKITDQGQFIGAGKFIVK